MPSSLVRPELASRCWSKELLQLWAAGTSEEEGLGKEAMVNMQDARRKAVMIMRKVQLHTEKMEQRLASGVNGMMGGVEAIWEKWSTENDGDRAGITSAQAADFLLDTEGKTRPNTLPAYAAHGLLMQRPDLFLADSGEMWETGRFLVRSRAERDRLGRVARWVEGSSAEDKRPMEAFVAKATSVILASKTEKADAEWTDEDLDIISILTSRLFEVRSTQVSPYHELVPSIVKALGVYSNRRVEEGLIAKLLRDLGVLPAYDSLEVSKSIEMDRRNMAMSGVKIRGEQDLLAGNEMDDLRQDFTGHRVYVIDDPTASELDDGISLEKIHESTDVWLHVHVADPTRYISPNHPLSINASFQGSSLYLPEGGRPLFPSRVIMKELSLGAEITKGDGSQGVLTFSARLDSNGTVQDSKVALGWIKKPRVVTYESVDAALGVERTERLRPLGTNRPDIDRAQPELTEMDIADLTLIRELAIKHRSKRFEKTGLEWGLPSGEVSIVSPTGPLFNLYDRSQLTSKPSFSPVPELDYTVSLPSKEVNASAVVAETMILAGKIAARFCSDHNLPVIFRGNDAPVGVTEPSAVEKLLASRDPGTGFVDGFEQLAANVYFSPGLVGTKPMNHWGMGIEAVDGGYIRATSPLRRFGDMIAHWQIKSALAKMGGRTEVKSLDENEVSSLATRSEEAAKRIKRAGKNGQAYWRAGLFMSRLEDPLQIHRDSIDLKAPLKARIAGSTSYLQATHSTMVPVHLTDLGCTASLMFGGFDKGKWQIGDEVSVIITGVCQWPVSEVTVKFA